MRAGALQWLGVAAAYAALAVFVGYFSASPDWPLRGSDEAVIKLSVSHGGQRRYECRERSAEELANLAANMRQAMDCPRERWPLEVALSVDGEALFDAVVQPTGLAKDGTSYVYRRITVPAGRHRVALSVLDSGESGAEPHRRERKVTLGPGEVLVVEFVNGEFQLVHPG